ncbi:hypothetical protein LEP1GSC123_2267 [Leptospira borgpetersenii str. 200701203]|uniref:Uncharacterized protein n=1 Tax=Leptospira borgpetersenii str. 200701203 TaxID=1193007 RepID=M3FEN3_LEPBO|nr:hypothetical protein LEP1GSC123_2267 [Leptospira borgpetersenii str. 200701203]
MNISFQIPFGLGGFRPYCGVGLMFFPFISNLEPVSKP